MTEQNGGGGGGGGGKVRQAATGKVTFLRANDVGSGFGPADDQIDVEAVIQLDTQPGKAFGFSLRDDNQQIAHQGMLNLLRDAFSNNVTTRIEFDIEQGKDNGTIVRVELRK